MAQVQYNFKIDEEIKDTAEELSQDFSNKQEFLFAMLESYKQCKDQSADTDIDMSLYEDIESKTKSILSDTFKHIIYTIQQNTSMVKQQLISVEEDKKLITDERATYKQRLEVLNAETNQKILDAQELYKQELEERDIKIVQSQELIQNKNTKIIELEKKAQDTSVELEQIKIIAQQVQAVISENTVLRAELSDAKASIKTTMDDANIKNKELASIIAETEKEAYKRELEVTHLKNSIESLRIELNAEKASVSKINLEVKNLEKENTILTTKLEILTPIENNLE